MRCDDGNMNRAMKQVNKLVQEARADMKKEMEKPFILRLFGSLFGMEGNKFQKLKEELPRVIKSGLPSFITKKASIDDKGSLSCTGMKLPDALDYLSKNMVTLKKLNWSFDSTIIEHKYLKPSLSVLQSTITKKQAEIVIQFDHSLDSNNGISKEGPYIIDTLMARVEGAKKRPRPFLSWVDNQKEAEKIRNLVSLVHADFLLPQKITFKESN